MQRIILLVGCLWCVAVVQAGGVFRCADPDTGAVTFSDVPCLGQAEAVSVPEANVMDSAPVRKEMQRQAAQRRAEEQAWLERKARQEAQTQQYGAERRRQDCAKVVRPHAGAQNGQLTAAQLDYLSRCQGYGPLSETAPSQPPIPNAAAPAIITNCDAGGCWDNLGNRYSRGAGPTFIRQDGVACNGGGGQMDCP